MSLIVIEGLDGAGKSTQIKLLQDFLMSGKTEYRYIHFPRTDAPYFGELITRFLRGEFGSLDQVDPYLVAMLYAGDRRDAAPMMKDWLNSGVFVLLDRYAYSNIAYQCAKIKDPGAREQLKNWILRLEFEHFSIPVPALNIFLDVPLSFTENKLKSGRSGEDRSYLNGSNDIHESSMLFQREVRNVYLETAKTDSTLRIIDCAGDKGEILPALAIHSKIVGMLTENHLLR